MVVGILAYEGVYNTELVASYDVFQHAGILAEQWQLEPRLRVVTIAPELTVVTTAEGMRVLPDHCFADAPALGLLVVPSGMHYEEDIGRIEWLRWIAGAADGAKYTISHCWGAFLLAASGRLEGKKATTYPPSIDRLKELFPAVQPVRDVRFVQDGSVITSAGGIASFEASLYLVQILYGEKAARSVAGGLVFSPENLLFSLPKQ